MDQTQWKLPDGVAVTKRICLGGCGRMLTLIRLRGARFRTLDAVCWFCVKDEKVPLPPDAK